MNNCYKSVHLLNDKLKLARNENSLCIICFIFKIELDPLMLKYFNGRLPQLFSLLEPCLLTIDCKLFFFFFNYCNAHISKGPFTFVTLCVFPNQMAIWFVPLNRSIYTWPHNCLQKTIIIPIFNSHTTCRFIGDHITDSNRYAPCFYLSSVDLKIKDRNNERASSALVK